MYTGLIGPSPFIAVLILVIFLAKGFGKITKASVVNKVLSVPWAGYLFLLNYSGHDFKANLISSILQIFFIYYYLKILDNLDDSVIAYLIFMVVGGFLLAFLYSFIYVILSPSK